MRYFLVLLLGLTLIACSDDAVHSTEPLTFPRKSGQVGYMLEVASEFRFS